MGSLTSIDVRATNRKNILNTLFRKGPMTKQELAQTLGLSLTTVFNILKELTDKGFIKKGDLLDSSGGRPPAYISPIFDAKLAVGVEISFNAVRFIILDLGPNIIVQEKHLREHELSNEYFENINLMLKDFIERNIADKEKLLGVGIALQYPIEKYKNVIFPASDSKPMSQVLDEIVSAFDMPVVIYNSAEVASIAQVWALGERNDFVYLMLSSTIGGALFLNHDVYGGGPISNENLKNCELGHMTIIHDGDRCSCGQRGCFECYCSSLAIENISGVSLDTFFAELENGTQKYLWMWDEFVEHLAIGINNLRVIFGLPVVIGGSLSPYLRQYKNQIKERLAKHSPFGESGDYMKISDLGEYGPAIGAALTQNDKFLNF